MRISILLTLVAAACGYSVATAQLRCERKPRPDTAAVDLIFQAELSRAERYTEMLMVDTTRATWPMGRLLLRPRHGWKVEPQTLPDWWDDDTLGYFMISVTPEEAPRLRPGSQVLVYMQDRHPAEDIPELVECGIRAAPDTTLGMRLYGPPQWRFTPRSMILAARCGLRLRESTGEIRLTIEPPAARSPYMSVVLFALGRGRPDSVIAPAFGVDTLPRLAPGAYRLWVRSLGYQVGDDTSRLSPGEILCVRARLVLSRVTLTPWP